MAGAQRSVEFDSEGFEAALQGYLDRLDVDTLAKARRLAIRAQRSMRQFAAVDTGRMRQSIGVTEGVDQRGAYFDVGPSVDYAFHVEYGTSTQEAQPFVRPGLLEAARDGLR